MSYFHWLKFLKPPRGWVCALRVIAMLAPSFTAAASSPEKATTAGTSHASVTTLEILRSLGGHASPGPLIRGSIAGRPAILLLDTGSTHNVLTAAFAQANSITAASSSTHSSGYDHAGNAMSLTRALPHEWSLGDQPARTLTEVLIAAGPPEFAKLNLAGVLSPQTFFPDQTLIFDFPANRLHLLSGPPAAIQNWIKLHYPSLVSTTLNRTPNTSAQKPTIEISLPGKPLISALIDTGAGRCQFPAAYLGSSATKAPSATSSTFSGATMTTSQLAPQTIEINGQRFIGIATKTRPAAKGHTALLGMSLLEKTILVLPPATTDTPLMLTLPAP